MGLLDYFNRGASALTGTTGNYGGLLGEDEQNSANKAAQMALAAQLLEAGGYSNQRVGLGQALGRGMGAAQQARQGSVDQALQAKLLQKQLMSANQKSGKPLAIMRDGKPVYVTPEEAIGGEPYSPMQRSEAPASIQEYQLAKEQGYKGTFYEWVNDRAKAGVGAPFQYVDRAGGKAIFDRTALSTPTQDTSAAQEAQGAATVASATTSAKTAAEATTQAQLDLPRVIDNADQAIKTIDEFEKHPGFNQVFGASSIVPVLPGTNRAGAQAYYDQIQGKTFLEAFNSLKGAGQITETEGTKATAAIARLSQAQSEPDAKKALADLKGVIKAGSDRAKKKAGIATEPAVQKRSREEILKQYGIGK
jgi:hypothetical protein